MATGSLHPSSEDPPDQGVSVVGAEELRRAQQINDSIIGEHGGGDVAPVDAMRDLGVDMMGLLEYGYEYSAHMLSHIGEVDAVVMEKTAYGEDIHTAIVFGAITMARALKDNGRSAA